MGQGSLKTALNPLAEGLTQILEKIPKINIFHGTLEIKKKQKKIKNHL